jgi:hypothetical protein
MLVEHQPGATLVPRAADASDNRPTWLNGGGSPIGGPRSLQRQRSRPATPAPTGAGRT